MKPLKDCRYSAFVSYSHDADKAHGRWVSKFHDELFTTLRGRLRRQLGGDVPPMHLSGRNGPVAGVLAQELEQNVADSYAMIIVVDENYLSSGWCLKELEYFKTLFGARGFEERLYVVAMSEPAMKQLAATRDWGRLVPPDLVWMPFFREDEPDLPVRIFNDNSDWTQAFQNELERLMKRMVESVKAAPALPPPPPPPPPPGESALLMGVPAPELAEAATNLAAALRQRGVDVRELTPGTLGEFAEFDNANQLVLPFGTGGAHLAPYKFMPGGHLAAQRDAWLQKGRPPEGLLWLDLRGQPCATLPATGHADLVAAVAPRALTPDALLARYQRRKADVTEADAGPAKRVNIYIESNQNEVDLWDDLGDRIKTHWQTLIQQYEPRTVPPMSLHARGLKLQSIDEERLDDADGVVLLWGEKDEASLRAQIKKVESKLVADPPPGIVAYLMPQQKDPQRQMEAAYWKVLRFQDADSSRIDIVPPEADRLEKFLRKILDRSARRKAVGPVAAVGRS